MDKKLKLELALQAARFANNILCEVSNSYTRELPYEAVSALRVILTNLAKIDSEIRSELMK